MLAAKAFLVDTQNNRKSHKLKLKFVRTELGLSQNQLATRAKLHFNVIKNCEAGESILLRSAFNIIRAINTVRKEQDIEPPLKMRDLDWTIYRVSQEELEEMDI